MTTVLISSEMLCNNPNPRIIQFEDFEYPLAFQLVGHKVDKMVKAAKILEELHCPFIINQNRYSIFDRTVEQNGILDADIEALIEERQAARKAKNFARADEIRDQLAGMGIDPRP